MHLHTVSCSLVFVVLKQHITVAILEEDLSLKSSFQTIFAHFFFAGGQNKRISVGFFSVYSIARKTVGLNPTPFHINYFYRAKINDFQWDFFQLFPFQATE